MTAAEPGVGVTVRRRVMLVLQNMGAGGAERVMANLANHLDRSRFEVDLVVLANRGKFFSNIENPEVRIADLGYARVLYAIPHLVWLLITRRPGVVLSTLGHINVIMALLGLAFRGTRFIGREANIPSIELANQRNPWLMALLFKAFYRKLDGVVCQSRDMLADLKDNFGVPDPKLFLIHNPADVRKITSLSEEGGSPYFPGGRNILFVGRLQAQKRPELLVRLMEQFSDAEGFRLHILGEGTLKPKIQELFAKSRVSGAVTFWGIQKNPYRFMKHADVLVLTSSHEGFPNVLLEANACGLPVVAFRGPGVTEEIIEDGVNGSLIEGDDLAVMAAKVREHAALRPDRQSLAARVEERFGIRTIIGQYESLLGSG